MYNILFVCYGNICRSPMAEMIFKDLIYKNSKRYLFTCASRATSFEEIGHDIYPKAKEKLLKENIKVESHKATRITKEDYQKYDYIIAMEKSNQEELLAIFNGDIQNKIHLLLDYTNNPHDILDPWYTGDFDKSFKDIYEGCQGLYNYLLKKDDQNEI